MAQLFNLRAKIFTHIIFTQVNFLSLLFLTIFLVLVMKVHQKVPRYNKAYGATLTKCAKNSDKAVKFYSTLSRAYDEVRAHSFVYIAGDFNAKVGIRRDSDYCSCVLWGGERGKECFLVQYCPPEPR